MHILTIRGISVFIDRSVGNPRQFRERRYLLELLHAASGQPAWPRQIRSVVVLSGHRKHHIWPVLHEAPPPRLLLVIGDEDARIRAPIRDAAQAILQQYVSDSPAAAVPVLQLPLGPGGSEEAPPSLPWHQRDLDVAFVGHLHTSRWPLARALGALPSVATLLPEPLLPLTTAQGLRPVQLPGRRTHIHFTRSFGAGLPRADYFALLARARIALVPAGFKQTHTFRHFEAARAGCVLVGAPLPDFRFPVLQPTVIDTLPDFLEDLLANPHRLYQAHQAVVAAWNRSGRAVAVGQQLAEQLRDALASTGSPPPG